MRKFQIKVNGNSYEVEVDEIKQNGSMPQNQAIIRQETPTINSNSTISTDSFTKTSEVPQGSNVIKAMMPGTILKININVGDIVRKGQSVLILEAMKMENEVVAGQDGRVAGVHVSVGSSVNAGDVLISIE